MNQRWISSPILALAGLPLLFCGWKALFFAARFGPDSKTNNMFAHVLFEKCRASANSIFPLRLFFWWNYNPHTEGFFFELVKSVIFHFFDGLDVWFWKCGWTARGNAVLKLIANFHRFYSLFLFCPNVTLSPQVQSDCWFVLEFSCTICILFWPSLHSFQWEN